MNTTTTLRRLVGFALLLVSFWGIHAGEAPQVVREPEDQVGVAGSTARFEAEVSGDPLPQLQWRAYLGVTFTNIPGATQSVLTLSNIQATAYRIALYASNDFGAVTSRMAILSVLRPPTVSRDPSSVAVVEGQSGTLAVAAAGTAPLSYQWFFEGVPVSGRTSATLSFSRVSRTNEGNYRVVISNAYGMVTSRVAQIRALPLPNSLEARLQPGTEPFQLRYRLFVPPQAQNPGDVRYPLVLSLHGSGEMGTDNLRQLSTWPQSMAYIAFTNQVRYPAFFVAPQCPPTSDWVAPEMREKLLALLESLKAEFPIDPERIYVTGLSLGGFGSWLLPQYHPGYFAAAIPIAGGGDSSQAHLLRDLAIWNFHSVTDGNVPVDYSREMVQAVRRAGGDPIYTEYADGGHEVWDNAWATPGLVEWTFAQRRGHRAVGAPALEIFTLPPGPVSEVGQTPLPLLGSAELLGGDLTRLTWTNFATLEGGVGTAGEPWGMELRIQPGVTNQVLLVGTTQSYSPAIGGSTTVSATRYLVLAPPILTTVSVEAGRLRIAWSGGSGPFDLQKATGLGEGVWTTIATNVVSPFEWLPDADAAYFRISQ